MERLSCEITVKVGNWLFLVNKGRLTQLERKHQIPYIREDRIIFLPGNKDLDIFFPFVKTKIRQKNSC